MPNTPNQNSKDFQEKYITSSEIMSFLGISRAGFLYGRRSGKIKQQPIVVNDGRLFIWERATVQADVAAWKLEITERKLAA